MTVEVLQTLSLISYIVAGVIFSCSVVLFFILDVPKLYGEVSGKTAQKAIEAIRHQNEEAGSNNNKRKKAQTSRVKLTDKITSSGRLESATTSLPVDVVTGKLATSALMPQSMETALLAQPTVVDGEFTVDVEMSFIGSSEIV